MPSWKPIPKLITIDAAGRTLNLPKDERVIGVESDEEVKVLHFQCPKIVENNVDLSQMALRINFANANAEKGQYIINDVAVSGSDITFSWKLSRLVTAYRGETRFVVCAIKTDSTGEITQEWNTELVKVRVLEGLEVENPEIPDSDKDIIAQLIEMSKQNADKAAASAQEAKEEADKVLDIIPVGGTKGQVLTKKSNEDKDYGWQDVGDITGTKNYDELENKPKINNVELEGNKTLEDLGIQPKGNYLTNVPKATENSFGGIKAKAKTNESVEAAIDENGKMFVPPYPTITQGDNGATFKPSVSPEGDLSWTNDKNLPNPESVNIKGPKGDTGEPGEPGVKGDPGTPGKDGTNGKDGKTPVKGVDYWTEPDKQEIISEVLEQIPGGGTTGELTLAQELTLTPTERKLLVKLSSYPVDDYFFTIEVPKTQNETYFSINSDYKPKIKSNTYAAIGFASVRLIDGKINGFCGFNDGWANGYVIYPLTTNPRNLREDDIIQFDFFPYVSGDEKAVIKMWRRKK